MAHTPVYVGTKWPCMRIKGGGPGGWAERRLADVKRLWCLHCHQSRIPTIPSAMASTITIPNANAGTRSSQKRQADDDNPSQQSPAKRPKKEGKLDKLKAQLKDAASRLKSELVDLREDILNRNWTKESAGVTYRALLASCNSILEGEQPDKDALAFFKFPFGENFEPEEVLRGHVSQGRLPSRRAQLP